MILLAYLMKGSRCRATKTSRLKEKMASILPSVSDAEVDEEPTTYRAWRGSSPP